jgi:hypothetical protein
LLLRAVAGAGDGAPGRRSPERRPRRALVVLAVSGLLSIAAGATAIVLQDEEQVPPALELAVTALFPDDRCIRSDEGVELVRAELNRLGYRDWTVVANPTNANEPCVFAGFDAAGQRVILVRNVTPEVQRAMDALTERLWTECLDAQEARELIGAELTRLRVQHWSVEVDETMGVTRDVGADRFRHFQQGCYVIVGSAREEAEPGAVTYLIATGSD